MAVSAARSALAPESGNIVRSRRRSTMTTHVPVGRGLSWRCTSTPRPASWPRMSRPKGSSPTQPDDGHRVAGGGHPGGRVGGHAARLERHARRGVAGVRDVGIDDGGDVHHDVTDHDAASGHGQVRYSAVAAWATAMRAASSALRTMICSFTTRLAPCVARWKWSSRNGRDVLARDVAGGRHAQALLEDPVVEVGVELLGLGQRMRDDEGGRHAQRLARAHDAGDVLGRVGRPVRRVTRSR